MRIELSCTACGKNRFSYPAAGGDEAVVTCEECDHVVGTLAELKERVAEAVLGGAWLRDSGREGPPS